jgi:hypothetical protein
VDVLVFLVDPVCPVVVKVTVADRGTELEDGFGAVQAQRAPVLSRRSFTRRPAGAFDNTSGDRVGLVKLVRLRGLRVLVDQPAEDRSPVNPGGVEVNSSQRRIRWLLTERAMWMVGVVVAGCTRW